MDIAEDSFTIEVPTAVLSRSPTDCVQSDDDVPGAFVLPPHDHAAAIPLASDVDVLFHRPHSPTAGR